MCESTGQKGRLVSLRRRIGPSVGVTTLFIPSGEWGLVSLYYFFLYACRIQVSRIFGFDRDRIEILIMRARYSNHEYIYSFLFNPVVPFRKHRVKLVSLPVLRGIPFVGVMSYQ